MSSLGGYSSFNSVSVFGAGDTNTPSLLDLSEFPSLTNRNAAGDVPQPSPMPGGKPYVGMVKQPTAEASEFTMSSEDFPALPGTQNREGASPGGSTGSDKIGGGAGDGSSVSRDIDKISSKSGNYRPLGPFPVLPPSFHTLSIDTGTFVCGSTPLYFTCWSSS